MPLPDAFPARAGRRPTTTPVNPHSQLDQNAPVRLQDSLRDHALALPGVRRGRSNVSVPGTVAFFLDEPGRPAAVPDLFGGEWGHIHPHRDGSLHLDVPTPDADRLIALGWAEYHHVVTQGLVPPVVIMVYGPRDHEEFAAVTRVVELAYLAAGGTVLTKTDTARAVAPRPEPGPTQAQHT